MYYYGNLKSLRSIIDIDDAMEAYWLTAKRGKIGEIYNIGGNKSISVKNALDHGLTSKKQVVLELKKLIRIKDMGINN